MPERLFILSIIYLLVIGCSPSIMPFTNDSSTYKGKFRDQLSEDEIEVRSWYHYVVSRKPDGTYVLRVFFPETKQLTHLTEYKDLSLKVQHGIVQEWWDDGSKRFEYIMKDGLEEGPYTSFSDGSVSVKGHYRKGKKEDTWKMYYSTDGSWTEQKYLNGTKIGDSQSFNGDGSQKSKDNIIYRDLEERKPCMKSCAHIEDEKLREQCHAKTMLTALYKSIKYPNLARNRRVQGTAIVQFVVDTFGVLNDVNVKRGICQEMKEECLTVVNNMPLWEAGVQRGRKVKVQYNLPIKFKLE